MRVLFRLIFVKNKPHLLLFSLQWWFLLFVITFPSLSSSVFVVFWQTGQMGAMKEEVLHHKCAKFRNLSSQTQNRAGDVWFPSTRGLLAMTRKHQSHGTAKVLWDPFSHSVDSPWRRLLLVRCWRGVSTKMSICLQFCCNGHFFSYLSNRDCCKKIATFAIVLNFSPFRSQ